MATWLWLAFAALLVPVLVWAGLRAWARAGASASELGQSLKGRETIAFFHPYAHAGGGGERVLWCAIEAVRQNHPGVECVVYTGDVTATAADILEHAKAKFGVRIEASGVHFVFLNRRRLVDASTWPRFTLLGQSLGSVLLGWEALCKFRPDVYVDSMGYAFTLPLFALLGGCRVACYVHYPTISTDMLAMVRSRDVSVCNDALVARSQVLSAAKLLYYLAFAWIYGVAGRFAEVVMVNSSWTMGHINTLWKVPKRTTIVFPPCDTATLAALPLARARAADGAKLVVSLAQFRPEKDHALQLRAYAKFLEGSPQHRRGGKDRVRLVVAGGCRDAGDRERVAALQQLCRTLGLQEEGAEGADKDWDVSFRTNISFAEMQTLLGQASVGLHTMREEHFGIGIVEFMAAGAIALAHKSGGPLMDIVTPFQGQKTGFLASDEASYAAALREIFSLSEEERLRMAKAARESGRDRFSQEAFQEAIAAGMISPLRPGTSRPKGST